MTTVVQGARSDKFRLNPPNFPRALRRGMGLALSLPTRHRLDYSRTSYAAPESTNFLRPPNYIKSITQHSLAWEDFVFMPRRLNTASRA